CDGAGKDGHDRSAGHGRSAAHLDQHPRHADDSYADEGRHPAAYGDESAGRDEPADRRGGEGSDAAGSTRDSDADGDGHRDPDRRAADDGDADKDPDRRADDDGDAASDAYRAARDDRDRNRHPHRDTDDSGHYQITVTQAPRAGISALLTA